MKQHDDIYAFPGVAPWPMNSWIIGAAVAGVFGIAMLCALLIDAKHAERAARVKKQEQLQATLRAEFSRSTRTAQRILSTEDFVRHIEQQAIGGQAVDPYREERERQQRMLDAMALDPHRAIQNPYATIDELYGQE